MKPRILIVDDEQLVRESVGEFLKNRLDCEVVVHAGGAEAIAAMSQGSFDVLIQDLQMPDIDGLKVIAHGKSKNPALVTILMTRLAEEKKIGQAEALGVIYIPKPFELKMVQKIIERELATIGGFEFKKV